MSIRIATSVDAIDICRIYNYYIRNTAISFEEHEVAAAEMALRISTTLQEFPWMVLEDGGAVVGYAYATKWRARSAYRFSVETSVYLDQGGRGRGWGSALYEALLSELSKQGVHAAIGGIALPNEASVRLHEKMGYKKVAHFQDVGFKHERWIDVGYWQKLL